MPGLYTSVVSSDKITGVRDFPFSKNIGILNLVWPVFDLQYTYTVLNTEYTDL